MSPSALLGLMLLVQGPLAEGPTPRRHGAAGPPPDVDFKPYNYAMQNYGRCAQSCFAMVYAHSTVPYFSMDAPRNVTLVYNQDRVDPKPFVHVNVQHTGGNPTPVRYLFRVVKTSNGQLITFLNGETTLSFSYVSGLVRIGGQFNASGNGMGSTGVYGTEIRVLSVYSDSSRDSTSLSTKMTVVNETGSDYARGWTLAGVQRLYVQSDSSVLITEGEGSAFYFAKSGSTWGSPPGDFSKVLRTGSGWIRWYVDSSSVSFNATGQEVAATDRFQNSTTFSYYTGYESRSLLQYITDPVGLSVRLNYGAWALDSIIDPMGRGIRLDVDYATRRVKYIADPDQVATTFTYDAKVRMITIQDRQGATTDFSYGSAPADSSDRLTEIQAPSIYVWGTGNTRPTTSLTPWQKLGVPYSSTSSSNFTPVLVDSVRAVVAEPGGGTTRFTVNRWGQPLALVDALNRTTTITYDTLGLLRSLHLPSYPNGISDTAIYNANGLPTYVKPATGTPTGFAYGPYGIVDSVSDYNGGFRLQTSYINTSGTGNPKGTVDSVSISSFDGGWGGTPSVVRFRYDTQGRDTLSKDALDSLIVKRAYDAAGPFGNVLKDSAPGNRVTTHLYDGFGRDTSVTPPGFLAQRTRYSYGLNRVTSVYDGAQTTSFSYDSLYLKSVTDPKGQVYEYRYNAVGWPSARKDPGVALWDSVSYNVDGDVVRTKNRRGQVITYAYDALHRLVKKSGSETETDSIQYSTDGRTITAISPSTTEISYLNALGQPDSVRVDLSGVGTYTRKYLYWTFSGNTSGRVYELSAITGGSWISTRKFRYDYLGNVDTMYVGSDWSRFNYNSNLQVSRTIFSANDTTTRSFIPTRDAYKNLANAAAYPTSVDRYLTLDAAQRVAIQQGVPPGGGASREAAYYYAVGRLSELWFRRAGTSCGYNEDIGWACTPRPTDSLWTFGNDANRNVTDITRWDSLGNVLGTITGSYESGKNRITGWGSCSDSLDMDGNVVRRNCPGADVRFTWSSDNLLTGIDVNSGTKTASLYYDGSGRLVKISTNSFARFYIWDGSELLAEINSGDGATLAEYSWYGPDRPHAIRRGGTTYWTHTDGLGNVIALTNASTKAVAQAYGYDQWGRVIASSGSVSDGVRWKGGWAPLATWSEVSDLHYLRARWYEGTTGRFLSEDPAGLSAGVNPYLFANGDPINGFDPAGLQNGKCQISIWYEPGNPPRISSWSVIYCDPDLSMPDPSILQKYADAVARAVAAAQRRAQLAEARANWETYKGCLGQMSLRDVAAVAGFGSLTASFGERTVVSGRVVMARASEARDLARWLRGPAAGLMMRAGQRLMNTGARMTSWGGALVEVGAWSGIAAFGYVDYWLGRCGTEAMQRAQSNAH